VDKPVLVVMIIFWLLIQLIPSLTLCEYFIIIY
jgi:hypothetical protein